MTGVEVALLGMHSGGRCRALSLSRLCLACCTIVAVLRSCVAEEPALQIRFAPPDGTFDETAPDGDTFVRHPWAIRDGDAEVLMEEQAKERGEEAPSPTRNVVTRDGIEFDVDISPETLPAGMKASLQIGLFSYSFSSKESSAEQWMTEGGWPSAHNPLRMTIVFGTSYAHGRVLPDDLGDACFGDPLRLDFCARVVSCLAVEGGPGGGGRFKVAVPMRWASNYRFEVYLDKPSSECKQAPQPRGTYDPPGGLAWWAPAVAEHVAERKLGPDLDLRHAAFVKFRLLHVSSVSYWWGEQAQVEPSTSWAEMMGLAILLATRSPAASPAEHQLPAAEVAPHGLWLEFGVGSGKSTYFIAEQLRFLLKESPLADKVQVHGFDSFRGLPTSWDHTHLGAGTFTTNGIIPEHLVGLPHVRIHPGWFQDTLVDLDEYGATPVAFAHIDVDIYSSAVETLSRIACQLYAGSVLVFDELVNYIGFELSGEYRAWQYVSAAYGIRWGYMGTYWQQAVPVIIIARGDRC